jgi:peptidylprolyl isomerase
MYDSQTMKLASTFLIFAAAAVTACAPLQAQTTTHSAVHHTAVRKHPAATGCSTEAAQPVLPAAVPRIAGCTDVLYALRYIDTVAGTGAPVVPRRWLTVAYTGYLMDGTKFDSSIGKDPITFPYGAHQVITGWDTGFEGMKVGGKRRLYIPYQLAYGEAGRAPVIPAKAELVFDVELVAVSENPPTPKTPPTPPAGSRPAPPAGSAPSGTGAAPSSTQQTVGKPTATPAPTSTAAPTDPTKPTAVPPPPPATTPKP